MFQEISYIYGLSSSSKPEDIRYIGYSKNPENRFLKHLSESKELKCHRHKWIQLQINNGYSIILNILRCVPLEDVSKCEIETILLFKSVGANLVNGNNGGFGGVSPTPEVREKLRKSKIGNKWNVGKKMSSKTKEALLKSNKGRDMAFAVEMSNKATRGKRNHRRKIEDSVIVEIYNLYNKGLTLDEVTKKLKLNKSTIVNILYSKHYKDVKDEFNLKIERLPYKNQFDENIQKIKMNKL